ncbi:CBM96 family carbohydrate-binding protein [Pontiella sulfatireligans]|uniref:Carbohydrate-binding module family 96 domain-containing protein n=1 Tax=Pontiella sulfatireligans TaxID=2750658 RepID=A0A6C2UGX5_9BACT|nr:DNRLRE domain-containing protein [Pontiella sulfatireligans]VGO18614.1 hypothetical protein SCARR_00667 [Pontiella sulfatireligans]
MNRMLKQALSLSCFLVCVNLSVQGDPSLQEIIEFQPVNANILPNGAFSMGLGAEPFYPGWRPLAAVDGIGAPATAPALPEIVDDGAQLNCLKFSMDSEEQMGLLLFKSFEIGDTNQVYYLHFKARASRTGIDLRPANNGATGGIVVTKPTQSLTTSWADYYVKIDGARIRLAPSLRFNIWDDGSSSGPFEVYIDDLMLVNDSWGIGGYELSPAEVVLTPEARNGVHFHGTDYPLSWNVQGTYADDVDLVLYLRDLSRDGALTTHALGTHNLSDGLVHSGTNNLANLKRGHYQALVAVLDTQSRELVAVGRELFSVMSDLTGLNLPAFTTGTDHGLVSNGNQYEYNYRGFWSTEEYYQQNFQNGLRVQRIYYHLDKLAPQENTFNWYLDNDIDGAASNGCQTLLVFPSEPAAYSTNDYDAIMAADPADGDGYWWIQQGTLLADADAYGHMSWPSNIDKYDQVSPETNFLTSVAQQCALRYGDNVHFIEYKNEANGAVVAQFMLDHIVKPVYEAYKTNSPNTKLFLSTTSNIDGNDPQVASYSTEFFDLGGTNYSDGYSFHAYGAATILPAGFDLSTPEAEGAATGIERMAVYKARAENYGLEFGQSEVFYFSDPNYPKLTGWQHQQRVLLDVSYGAQYTVSVNPIGLYTFETGVKNAWRNRGTGVPSTPCVALNGMYRILEGASVLGVIEKGTEFLIGTFQTQRTGMGTRYVAALAAGNNTKIAELSVDLSGIGDLVAYDQWGEAIAVPQTNGMLYVGRDALYLETASATALFDALQVATLTWRPGIGIDQVDGSLTAEEQVVALGKSGMFQENENLVTGAFTASRVAAVSSDYIPDLTSLVLSGSAIAPDTEGTYVLEHASLPGSGAYTKMSALVASAGALAGQQFNLTCTNCDEATLFVNGQTLYDGPVSNLYYRTDWIQVSDSLPTGLTLVELVFRPAANVSLVMLEAVAGVPLPQTGDLACALLEDTYVYSAGDGDDIYGTDDQLLIRGSTGWARRSFIKFDLRTLLGEVTNAVLRMYAEDANTDVLLRSVSDNAWAEETMVWTNAPFASIEPTVLATATATNDTWFELDLSGIITNAGIYSFVLDATTTDNSIHRLTSSEGGANAPVLELDVVLDLDSDQLPDSWEAEWLGGYYVSDGSGDFDADGFIDLHEYMAGTNPTNSASIFEIENLDMASAQSWVQWSSISGKTYAVEYSDDLLEWHPLPDAGSVYATGSETGVVDTNQIVAVKFYRVGVLPE